MSSTLLRMLLTSRDTSRISILSRSPPAQQALVDGGIGIQPPVPVARADCQRHPVMDLGQRARRVGRIAASTAASAFFVVFRSPGRPQPGHEQAAVAAVHVERRSALAGRGLAIGPPLVPAVHRDQAALVLRCSEGGRAGDLLGPSIDQQRTLESGCRPRRSWPGGNKAPAHGPHPPRGRHPPVRCAVSPLC